MSGSAICFCLLLEENPIMGLSFPSGARHKGDCVTLISPAAHRFRVVEVGETRFSQSSLLTPCSWFCSIFSCPQQFPTSLWRYLATSVAKQSRIVFRAFDPPPNPPPSLLLYPGTLCHSSPPLFFSVILIHSPRFSHCGLYYSPSVRIPLLKKTFQPGSSRGPFAILTIPARCTA